MPPIILFGRKWNIATDDFVYLSFWEFLFKLVIIVVYFHLNYHKNIVNFCHSNLYEICHFLLSGILICNLTIIIVIMVLSAQGLIMEQSKRSKVSVCIYIKIFMIFCEAILSIIVFTINYKYSLIPDKCAEQILIPNKIILYYLGPLLFIYLIIIYFTYDKLGKTGCDVILLTKKKKLWKNRLKCFLCIKTTNFEEKSALDSAANVLASLFEESNLVFSDYEAGIQLLCQQDAEANNLKDFSLQINKSKSNSTTSCNFNEKVYTIISNSTSNTGNEPNLSYLIKLKNGLEENLLGNDSIKSKKSHAESYKLNLPSNISIENKCDFVSDWRDLRFIYYFSTMAKASYGWPIHLLFQDKNKSRLRFCMGLCCNHATSCLCNKCICCDLEKSNSNDQTLVYVKESFCSCHAKAILNETHLKKENLICVSFYNKTFHSPFFIAISHEIQAIILSIRGTFSLKDVLTDVDASHKEIFENGPSGFLAHSGMLNAAKNIKQKIQDENIIHNIMNDNKNYRLIITGHSLGAGIATILSCFYYHEFPNLKCYAFSPPLGTVNIKMADYCKDYVLTIVNGVEWVPRISLQSVTVVKHRLIQCLENYPHSKFQLFIKKIFKCKCSYCNNSSHKWNMLNAFERDAKFWNDVEVNAKLPGQIIQITNIKTILDQNKLDLLKSNCNFYTPIITSSEQFNTVIFHRKMFKDHFPHEMVKRLHNILKANQLYYPKCHHYLKHYWPVDNPNDIMKLPFLSEIIKPEVSLTPRFRINCFNRKSLIKQNKKSSDDSISNLYLIYKITVV